MLGCHTQQRRARLELPDNSISCRLGSIALVCGCPLFNTVCELMHISQWVIEWVCRHGEYMGTCKLTKCASVGSIALVCGCSLHPAACWPLGGKGGGVIACDLSGGVGVDCEMEGHHHHEYVTLRPLRGPANPMRAQGPKPGQSGFLGTQTQGPKPGQSVSVSVRTRTVCGGSFVRRRYIETLERPSQHHASSGTQTMSLQCNLRRHLLHKSSKPATHKVRDTTSNMYKA